MSTLSLSSNAGKCSALARSNTKIFSTQIWHHLQLSFNFWRWCQKKSSNKKAKAVLCLGKNSKSFQPKCDTTSNFLNCWRWCQKTSNKIAKAVLWLGKIQNSYQPKCDTTSIFFQLLEVLSKKGQMSKAKGVFFFT